MQNLIEREDITKSSLHQIMLMPQEELTPAFTK